VPPQPEAPAVYNPAPPVYSPAQPALAPAAPAYSPFGGAPTASPVAANVPWMAVAEPRRSRKGMIAIILLAVALAGAIAAVVVYFIKLDEANARIEEQNEQIQDQKNLIDQKETFGAAMSTLLETAKSVDGIAFGDLIPFDKYELYAAQGWVHRWSPEAMARDVVKVETATEDLEAMLSAAATEAGTNSSGSIYETVLDQLGSGFVTLSIDDADTLCQSDVLACVTFEEPYVVHVDAADDTGSYMNDELRTGVAYHEFAHVLQLANPEPTLTALESFGGDDEIMADCYALTYLDGWTLEHRVRVGGRYYLVSIGYGYTCDEAQRQVIRDWYAQLGFHFEPISQERARV
jgi:hypothetical protein